MATRNEIKANFETGDKPTQAEFYQWIDSDFNLDEDTTDDITEGNAKFISQSEKDKLAGIEASATVGADWDTNVANKPTTISQAQADEIAFQAKARAYATLTDAVAQNIDIAVNHNAKCEVQLLGDATFTLTNLTEPCEGVITIVAQTVDRTISIAGATYIGNEAIVTEAGNRTAIGWLYDGTEIMVNKGSYGAV